MERRPEAPPKSLAQLIARRGRAGRNGWPTAEPTADALGQFGLLFSEPEPEAEEPVVAEVSAARKLWSVAELVGVLRGRLEREYGDVWVEGEISNARPAASGAFYFTLKDGEAQLPAVLFRRQAAMLKWKPADGMAVLARGRISVFEPRGQLQLIAENLEPRGAGALQLQFEQLKAKLRAEGLFDAERKRALPAYPGTIGVVTSTQGAVIRDIVTVCRRRNGCLNILVYPAAVQGTGAAAEILAGVRYFNETEQHRVDAIVVARGGGSTEDLWAFNDEALARGIAASQIPVVSAVGHETDFTIADFVADLRAPTPSAAAELITEAQHRAAERVDALRARLLRGVRWQAMSARQRFARVSSAAALRLVPEAVERRVQRMDALEARLQRAEMAALAGRRSRLEALSNRLLRQDSSKRIADSGRLLGALEVRLHRAGGLLGVAQRGLLKQAQVDLQRAGSSFGDAQRERLLQADVRLQRWGGSLVVAQQQRLQQADGRMRHAATRLTAGTRQRLERATLRLQAMSPHAVLERGYSLAFGDDGRLLRSVRQVQVGAAVRLRLADGTVDSRVVGLATSPEKEEA